MIKSFSNTVTEKIFNNEPLTRKETRSFGDLNLGKAYERLKILNRVSQTDLLQLPPLRDHTLYNGRYSIDASSRRSIWRIIFEWSNEELTDVELVNIEDTH
ncbi:MAG: plasmid maintenance system killer protein [Cryomorphaceae bacterium]|jgi:plasmid maintenance system killer protein